MNKKTNNRVWFIALVLCTILSSGLTYALIFHDHDDEHHHHLGGIVEDTAYVGANVATLGAVHHAEHERAREEEEREQEEQEQNQGRRGRRSYRD